MNQTTPMTVSRQSTPEERQIALYQIYQQVLERQPYLYERKILAKIEKDFLTDKIGVKRFLKELGHSEVYLNSFYHNFSNIKFLELCFKHFLGRGPVGQEEIQTYCNILMHKGPATMITALLDSEEYRKVFGCFTIPYSRQQPFYPSPKAYIETQLLNGEYIGQRGRSVPTIYWHQLGLKCEGGTCRHPEADENIELSLSQEELAQLLELLRKNQPEKTEVALSPQQRALLRRVIG